MPDFAELEADGTCTHCGQPVALPGGAVHFQWGEVPHHYRPGRPVEWRRDRRGAVLPPFRYVERRTLLGRQPVWNAGEPRFRDLYAFDSDPNGGPFPCPHCATVFETVAAQISDGVLTAAVLFRPGQAEEAFGAGPQDADIVLLRPDGSPWPRPDWNDPPLIPYEAE